MRGIDGDIITICVLSDGVDALLDERAVPYVQGRDYVLEVRVDGALVLTASDGDIAAGTVALYAWANHPSYFDDIVVEGL